MANFQQYVVNQVNVDHEVLSAFYTSLSLQGEQDAELLKELETVRQHVETCHKLWTSIQSGRLKKALMGSLYVDVLNTGKIPATLSKVQSHREKKIGAGSTQELTRLTHMRALANVWKEMCIPEDVPRLCLGNEEILRWIKVSCGATVESWSKNQRFV